MLKFSRNTCLTIFLLLFFVSISQADSLITRNGDRLFGKILTPVFALQAPYGQIVVRTDFLKKISFVELELNRGQFLSINNDTFSGVILNYDARILLERGGEEKVRYDDIATILIENEGPRHRIGTSIVKMLNNDKFSGLIKDQQIRMLVAFNSKTIPTNQINRIEFKSDTQTDAKVLLTNGDLLNGRLQMDQILIAPDSISEVLIASAMIKSIQFNSEKLVLKEFTKLPPAEQDGDWDNVPDDSDKCPQTPWGQAVNSEGCTDATYAAAQEKTSENKSTSPDNDKDNVLDVVDRCLDTPSGVKVDSKGCWSVGDIFFEFGKFRLSPHGRSTLNKVILVMQKNPGLKIEIRGYTDNLGSHDYNQWLSEKRAQAVKAYLVSKGISGNRLSAKGFGSSNNKAANATPQGRALNRRVEIVRQLR